MGKIDWKETVRAIAPTIGTLLGGPLAGTSVRVLADKLLGNPDASEEKIADMVSAGLTPEQVAALKKADQEFELHMKELDIETFKTEVADTQNARSTFGGNMRVFWLAMCILTASMMVLIGSMWGAYRLLFVGTQVDQMLANTVFYFLGTIVSYALMNMQKVVEYFFGSSAGSKQKTDAMAEAFTKIRR